MVWSCSIAVLVASLGIAFGMQAATDIPASVLFRDPVASPSSIFAAGWFSNLGAVCWIATATACLLVALAARSSVSHSLLYFGLLTAVLGIDDLFLMHDGLMPFLGLPGAVVYPIYLGVLIAWGRQHQAGVTYGSWALLIPAVACLGSSAVMDNLADLLGFYSEAGMVMEDASKLLGILLWAGFGFQFAIRSSADLRVTLRRPEVGFEAPSA